MGYFPRKISSNILRPPAKNSRRISISQFRNVPYRNAEQLRRRPGYGRDIRGLVDGCGAAVRHDVRAVRFQAQAAGRNRGHRGARPFTSGKRDGAGKRDGKAESFQCFHKVGRPRIRMNNASLQNPSRQPDQLDKPAECPPAVYGHGPAVFSRDCQLPGKRRFLIAERGCVERVVEPDLAHPRAGRFLKEGGERICPFPGPLANIPWMKPERRKHCTVRLRQPLYLRPIRFTASAA